MRKPIILPRQVQWASVLLEITRVPGAILRNFFLIRVKISSNQKFSANFHFSTKLASRGRHFQTEGQNSHLLTSQTIEKYLTSKAFGRLGLITMARCKWAGLKLLIRMRLVEIENGFCHLVYKNLSL